MKTLLIILGIIIITVFFVAFNMVGSAWACEKEVPQNDPKWGEARIADPKYQVDTLRSNDSVLFVIVREWIAYQGCDPNQSPHLDKLIEFAEKELGKEGWKLVEVLYTPQRRLDLYGGVSSFVTREQMPTTEPQRMRRHEASGFMFPAGQKANISCLEYGYLPCIRKRTLLFTKEGNK